MKKLFLLFLGAAFTLASCKKEDNTPTPEPEPPKMAVKKEQGSIGFNMTATWCGPCGQWGFPAFNAALNTHGEKFVGIKVNGSNTCGLFAPISRIIANDFNITGWPNFAEGTTNQATSTSAWNNAIANRLANNDPTAGIGLEAKVEGDKVIVKTRTLFFKDAAADKYSLALYLLEDGVMANQSGANPAMATHNSLLRAGFLGEYPWGEVFKNGAIKANEDFEKTYELTIPTHAIAINKSKLRVAGAIFTLNASNKPASFINATQVKVN